jgi:hypothetical protein
MHARASELTQAPGCRSAVALASAGSGQAMGAVGTWQAGAQLLRLRERGGWLTTAWSTGPWIGGATLFFFLCLDNWAASMKTMASEVKFKAASIFYIFIYQVLKKIRVVILFCFLFLFWKSVLFSDLRYPTKKKIVHKW